jgi:intracellular septation protein A
MAAPEAVDHSAPRFGALYRTLGLSIGAPLVVVEVLLHLGRSPTVALACGALFPLADLVYGVVRSRRLGAIPALSFVAIVAGLGLAFATGNALFAILKDSLFTTVFGLVFLGSLLGPRPLIFQLNRDLAGEDAGALAAIDALWERPAARQAFRLMTLVWGVGLLLEASVRVVVALTLPVTTAAALSPLIPVAVIGGLLVWTVRYVRARRAAAAASER